MIPAHSTLKRLFIITGDVSGDSHASVLVRQFQQQDPALEIQAVGGKALRETGIPILYPQEKMGVFGLAIFQALWSHYQLGKKLLQHFRAWRPDAVLLIDYGMFNLWMAKQLKPLGIKIFYYIPPQVWASRPGRLKTIKAYVDHVFCIFPFEKTWYDRHGIPNTYVGHPLVQTLPPSPDRHVFCESHGLDPTLPIIGIFPGSRKSEFKRLLPPMMGALRLIQQDSPVPLQFVLVRSPAIPEVFFQKIFRPLQPYARQVQFQMLKGENHAILALSQAVMVASGTVTLEAALYQTPAVIAYKLPWLDYQVAKRLVTVPYIGLPNLLSEGGEGFLPELLMDQVTPQKLAEAMRPYLHASEERSLALAQCQAIRGKLAGTNAAETVVHRILCEQTSASDKTMTEVPVIAALKLDDRSPISTLDGF